MTANKSDKICVVCGDVALSRNFGAITCEPCKAFFRRHALKRETFICDLNGICVMDINTRSECKKCRIEKCFAVGMKHQFIRNSDELEKRKQLIGDNKRKRDKTQPSVVSSTTETSIVSSSEISSSDENTKINEFLTQLLDNTFDVNEDELIREITDIENSFKNNVMDILDQLSRKITITPMYRKLVDYNGLRELEITRINELLRAAHIYTIPDGFETQMKDYKIHRIGNQSELLECVVKVTEISINALMSYVNGLPAFAEVCSEDQLALVKYGLSEFNSIRSLKYLHNNDIYTTLKDENSCLVISLDMLTNNFSPGTKYCLKHIMQTLSKLCEDSVTLELIAAITLFNPNRPNLLHKDTIVFQQQLYIYLLQRHLLLKCGSESEAQLKVQNLMNSLIDIQVYNEVIRNCFPDLYKPYLQNSGPIVKEIYE